MATKEEVQRFLNQMKEKSKSSELYIEMIEVKMPRH